MDEMEIDPEIAAAMGFTSFGASNKRKFTGTSDSYVEGQDNNKRKNQMATFGTGANDAPLGTRNSSTTNADVDAQMMEQANTKDEESAKVTHKNGKAKDKKKKGGAPLGLADYISWGNSVPEEKPKQTETSTALPTTNAQSNSGSLAATAQRTNTTPPSIWPQGMPSPEELAALRRGVRNTRGDMAYFLPSFIQDPWESLVG